jgi:hypothetical protein
LIDAEKWRHLINDKTSVQILETFVYELGGKKEAKNMTEYHTGLGNDIQNPPHLRVDGKVKKISVIKRDICLLLKELWKQREGQTNVSISKMI